MSRITRLVLGLALLATTSLAGASTAVAHPFPLPDDPAAPAAGSVPVVPVGTPLWQVVVIGAAAALLAAVVAYLVGSRSTRGHHTAPSATRGPTAAAA